MKATKCMRSYFPFQRAIAVLWAATVMVKIYKPKKFRRKAVIKMKLNLLFFILLFIFGNQSLAVDSPTCLKHGGEEKCGYGCVKSFGEIYCGEKPGMACLTYAGKTKCGFDCKQYSGKIECGSEPGDICVTHAGNIKCGQACRIDMGQIKCGIDPKSHGRDTN